MKSIKVFVIDDSALVRAVLTQIIESEPDMTVVGQASDPLEARERMRDLAVDVVTLDVEMPRMDGLDFLGRLMRLRPTPVVMISTLTRNGADTTLRALELGAVDYVAKPQAGLQAGLHDLASEIVEKVRVAAKARVRRSGGGASDVTAAQRVTPTSTAGRGVVARPTLGRRPHADTVIAIGSSTGGTEAVRSILERLPADMPPIVVTQHMPAGFTQSFAQRLDGLTALRVCEARHGMRVARGTVYIAPGGRQMAIERGFGSLGIVVSDDPPVNRHRPSVDYLFRSVAAGVGRHAIGVVLTGMGRDGADAMLEMRQAGAFNIAQDEATCVVFGMPREAIARGAVHAVVPLEEIADRIVQRLEERPDPERLSGERVAG